MVIAFLLVVGIGVGLGAELVRRAVLGRRMEVELCALRVEVVHLPAGQPKTVSPRIVPVAVADPRSRPGARAGARETLRRVS